MTPANGLIPDTVIVLVGYLIGFRAEENFLFYYVCYWMLVFATSVYFLRSAGTSGVVATAAGLAAVLLAAFLDGSLTMFDFVSAAPAHHGGVLPLALLCFGLALRVLAGLARRWTPVALAATLAAACFSDAIAIPQVAAPIIATCLLVAFLAGGRAERRRAFAGAGLALLAGLAGIGLKLAVDLLPHVDHGRANLAFDAAPRAALTFLQSLDTIFWAGLGPVHAGALGVGCLLGVVAVRRLRRPPSACGKGALLLLTATAAALAAPLLAGTWSEYSLMRQQVPGYFLPVLLAAWGLGDAIASRWGARAAVAVAGGLALVALALQVPGATAARVSSLDGYREMATDVGQYAPALILAEYWDAKPLWYLSRMPVCSATGHGDVYPWITNIGWCLDAFEDWRAKRGTLIIGGRSMQQGPVLARYGEPAARFATSDAWFWVYPWSAALDARLRQSLCLAYGRQRPLDLPAACVEPAAAPGGWVFTGAALPGKVGWIEGSGRTAEADRAPAGHLTYGPYVDLAQGRYAVTIAFSATATGHGWDAVHSGGARVFAAGAFADTSGERRELTVQIDAADPLPAFEFRTHFGGSGTLSVWELRIELLK